MRVPGQGTVFVPLGERRIRESIRGLGWLGLDAVRQQTHLGIPEYDFEPRFDEVVGRTAKVVFDNRARRLVGFGPDGYDGHLGHKQANNVMWAVADEVARYGHDVEVHEINSAHRGELRYGVEDWALHRQLGAMGMHATQYYIDSRGPGSYEHEIIIGGHAMRTDTWMMLAEGGVLELVQDGVTYDVRR